MLQQYLPFTVLKLFKSNSSKTKFLVATVPTVYGIETKNDGTEGTANEIALQQYLPFTVLKQYIL